MQPGFQDVGILIESTGPARPVVRPDRLAADSPSACVPNGATSVMMGTSPDNCPEMRPSLASALILALVAPAALAGDFAAFTPLAGDPEAGSLPETAPFVLSSPCFRQTGIAHRDPSGKTRFDSGTWDMLTVNETGPHAGRFLFTVFETRQAGIQRTDLRTLETTTLWHSPAAAPAANSHRAFDAVRWTPWGGLLTGEEAWGGFASRHGRLFELVNPLADPPQTVIRHRAIVPRVAHEGLIFDRDNNLYFVDEHQDGHIFRYASVRPDAASGDAFFAAGQTALLRVGDGRRHEATGSGRWIPLTTREGMPLPGVVTVEDPDGQLAIDGRATGRRHAFRGTGFGRPEDLDIRTLPDGRQLLFFTATTHHKVFSIDLANNTVKLFASRATPDMATGAAVGAAFSNPDNLAVDVSGNVYIVEDQPGGRADIWFARDDDGDGVAEAIGKWASLTTVGAEPSGLYFDPLRPGVAYVNVQHPASGVDRTFLIRAETCGLESR